MRMRPSWEERLRFTDDWYRDLSRDAPYARHIFTTDYAPIAPLLGALSGSVLDIGAGSGVTRHYLPRSARYVALEPSLSWRGLDWSCIAEFFPCLSEPFSFVRGVGEELPFRSGRFDAAVCLWSLNHAREPAAVFPEAARVLRPGGEFVLVIEDAVPRASDFLRPSFLAGMLAMPGRPHLARLRHLFRHGRWPLEADHVRVTEAEVARWSRPYFAMTVRAWVGQYLTFVFHRRHSPRNAAPSSGARPPRRR